MKHISLVILSIVTIFLVSGCSVKGIEFSPDYNSIKEILQI